jgi:uncharacterized caspase-like protein
MSETAPIATVSASNVYALVVGLGSYQDQRIPRLKHTYADAQAFYQLLQDPQGMGVPPENILLLLDEKATLTDVKCAITGWLFEHATQDSTVLLFFAGHGHVEPDRSGRRDTCEYLLLWDAQPENLYATALSNEEFERCLFTVRAKRLVVFMDACHSGGVAKAGARDVGTVHEPKKWIVPGEGRVIITAAKASQQSWEDPSLGHGIFTYHLLEALRGMADTNQDGKVSITEVYSYLERNVPASARKLKHAVQEPFFYGELGSDMVLTVDSRRVQELAARDAEAERRREAELHEKQRRLFELYSEHQLPLEAYRRAMGLVEQRADQLSPGDQGLSELLELLLKGQLTVERYLKFAYFIPEREAQRPTGMDIQHFKNRRQQLPPAPSGAGSRTLPGDGGNAPPRPVQRRFCIHCGARLQPSLRFCTSCGKAVLT